MSARAGAIGGLPAGAGLEPRGLATEKNGWSRPSAYDHAARFVNEPQSLCSGIEPPALADSVASRQRLPVDGNLVRPKGELQEIGT